uniref:CDGSH iron-sulfur domain-containing protein 2 homologue n=1 Tax=Steinernema glaseri TaxID=37863 RepID=A0A1I7XYR3_9BILA
MTLLSSGYACDLFSKGLVPSTSSASSLGSEVSNMVCPHSAGASSTCHSKAALYAVAILAGGAALGYWIGWKMGQKRARQNHEHKLSSDKVVDTVDVEDIGEKMAFCRCWKSKKFPLCDGTHNKHNQCTGDNLGPLIVKGKAPETQ